MYKVEFLADTFLWNVDIFTEMRDNKILTRQALISVSLMLLNKCMMFN